MDNGSIYTKNLTDFLSEKKVKFVSQKADDVDLSDMQKFYSFILSGRRANDRKMRGEETVVVENKNEICDGEMGVTESHKYEISQLGPEIHNLASSKSCKYEIVKHNSLNIFGTQFHPEMSNDGQTMIEAFLSL